jgi:glutamine amidotransferase
VETVAVIDYGVSNLRSVAKALEHVAGGRHRIEVTGDLGAISRAARVVFPGQGAIGQCMASLADRGLVETLRAALVAKPFLGICLGLQSLMDRSDEDGGTACLGLIPGRAVRFPGDLVDPASGARLKIPHMGWNRVQPAGPHPLWAGIEPGTRFYFVHSYHVVPDRSADIAATTDHGVRFVSAVMHGNLFAIQFHPEKSQAAGLRLLANFLDWNGELR